MDLANIEPYVVDNESALVVAEQSATPLRKGNKRASLLKKTNRAVSLPRKSGPSPKQNFHVMQLNG